jgi:hypothetical protein
MTRTIEAPQAKSQAGTGRSFRPTSACAEAKSGATRAANASGAIASAIRAFIPA